MHSIKHANEYFSSKQKCPHPLYDVFNMHRLRIFFFIPLMPVPPEVTSASRVYGYFGRPAVIICHVHTLVPFQLSWQRDGIDLGPSVTHPWVAIVIYEYSRRNSLILCYRNKLSQSQVGWLTVRISYVIFILSSLRTQVFLCGKRMSPPTDNLRRLSMWWSRLREMTKGATPASPPTVPAVHRPRSSWIWKV